MTILRVIRIARCHIHSGNNHMNRTANSLMALIAILFAQVAESTDPRPKTRSPDDRMLQQPERVSREVRAPVTLNEIAPNEKTESKSLFSELPLSGPRGKETPTGSVYGRYCQNGFFRSGFPNCIGLFAKPSPDACHQVGYVGGGTLFGGSSRYLDEGTFGMDYSGHWFSRKTWLKWSHGNRHQGGAGRYETEGPRLIPE
jgi:hypothetical protein